jgi:hypothetical protein
VLGRGYRVKHPDDFVGTEHDRQSPRLLRRRDQIVDGPGLLEGDLIEKSQGADRDLDRTGREVSLARQVDLIRANLFRAQVRRRPPKVPSEPGHILDVGALGVRGQIPNLHVLEHALSKRGHRRLLCNGAKPIQARAVERIEGVRSDRRELARQGRGPNARSERYREAV